jgi:putative tryptophan/tyrosine transport system substrate-binding protein
VKRREFITLVGGAAAWPLAAVAQQAAARERIAWIHPSAPLASMQENGADKIYAAFVQELHRLGRIEGANLVIERYSGEGRRERYEELARTVVQTKPAVIFTSGTDMTRYLAAATGTIPIVAVLTDPVASGLIANLAHPDRNITGASVDAGIEIWSKRLAIMKEAIPTATRLGFLSSRSYWEGAGLSGEASRAAAAKLGLSLVPCLMQEDVQDVDYRQVFGTMRQNRLDGLVVSEQVEHHAHQKSIVTLTQEFRIPAIFAFRDFVELGGLMAYAVDLAGAFRQAAQQVDQILKGSSPSQLPFFQQTRFELVINLATAKTLGLNISPTLLARADEVIE